MKAEVEDLIGKTIASIDGAVYSRVLTFKCTDGSVYKMEYFQDCCANCSVEDICGDLTDLIGLPVVRAEMPSSLDNFDKDKEAHRADDYVDSYTWTFIIIGTAKGTVTIRWFGSSNGYYSESPDFYLDTGKGRWE